MTMQTAAGASRFAEHIRAATGVTAPADVAEIEDVMSDFSRTFDSATAAQLRAWARRAWQVVQEMRADPDMVARLMKEMGT